ncbi:MAG: Ig-like domain-containing protein, partial [Spirochaeta sp.]
MSFSVRVLCAALMMSLIAAGTAFSRGTPEDAWQDVEGTENWRHEVDISEQDPGTYNIIIRGVDYAGNEYIEGPFNIRIDPESDKPVSRVIYPEPGEVVRGMVDIVGIAVDDDEVDRVQVRLDEGTWQTAEGTEYWRYQVPAGLLEDGSHSIEVRAIDNNGVEGDIYPTQFVLDTLAPEVEITSHNNGSIVNGRVNFEGVVRDVNGIELLELSRDNRETYESIRTRRSRGESFDTFSFDVRTDQLEDGPVIYWLRSTDATGARAVEPFLFFIDNESPEITIYEPQPEEAVYGIVQITGAIRDEVGVER